VGDLIKYKEGLITFLAPNLEKYRRGSHIEPAWAPVFYNPRMRLSRDIGVALIEAYCNFTSKKNITIMEPLSATGVRGLRYAKEVKCVSKVYLNDLNRYAFKLIESNIRINDLTERVECFNDDANALMYRFPERIDVIDLDPFGSPAYFIVSALKRVKHKGMICATAPDLPPLLGIYPNVAWRRYFARSLRTEFGKEIGMRILLGYFSREAARLRKGIKPLFVHATDHYFRVCVQVIDSPGVASKNEKSMLGYLIYCRNCLYRGIVKNIENRRLYCPICKQDIEFSGPLWVGKMWNKSFVEHIYNSYAKRRYFDGRGLRILEVIMEEVEAPRFYYKSDVISKRYGMSRELSPRKYVTCLKRYDPTASRTHFDPKGFRTVLHPRFFVDRVGN